MTLPIGVLVDSAAVLLGGLIGSRFGDKIPANIRLSLPEVFSLAAFGLAINSIVKLNAPAAVVLALMVGFVVGKLLKLEERINAWGRWMAVHIGKGAAAKSDMSTEQYLDRFTLAVVLFCASSLNVYGTVASAVSGDHSILFAKAVLDFFTAIVFATAIGYSVAFLSLVQLAMLLLCYFIAAPLSALITPQMFQDFSCCGGVLLLATGFRLAGIKQFAVASMLPALILVMPLSYLWGLLGI